MISKISNMIVECKILACITIILCLYILAIDPDMKFPYGTCKAIYITQYEQNYGGSVVWKFTTSDERIASYYPRSEWKNNNAPELGTVRRCRLTGARSVEFDNRDYINKIMIGITVSCLAISFVIDYCSRKTHKKKLQQFKLESIICV